MHPLRPRVVPALLAVVLSFAWPARAADFSDIEPLLQQHCVECHGDKEPDGSLVLESFAGLMKGGEAGAAVVPGKSADSLLVKALEGRWGKTGKNEFMPPGKREHLTATEIALIRAWIDAGAPGPKAGAVRRELEYPRIQPTTAPRRPINDLAFEPKARLIAVARNDGVELVDSTSRRVIRTLRGRRGTVNDVEFSPDGKFVFAAVGIPGVSGEVRQWSAGDGTLVRTFEGHRDSIQAMAVSVDGTSLATGSYDYGINLWSIADGKLIKGIQVHQGAISGLAFRADGKVLASAAFDRTAKLISLPEGERLETLGQALKELNAVAFSPDGHALATGGNDNRIRVYRVSAAGREGSNELESTAFVHEGGILRLAFSSDGRTLASTGDDRMVKLHEFPGLRTRVVLERQPDWPTALAFLADNQSLVVGRADGTLGYYRASDGTILPAPKPELVRVEPRGIERGTATRVRLVGASLDRATAVLVYRDGLYAAQALEWNEGEAWVTLQPPAGESRRAWELAVTSESGESSRVKVWVDDVPQLGGGRTLPVNPVSAWGNLEQGGQVDEYQLTGRAGSTVIFDVRARELGSQANVAMELRDSSGSLLASNEDWSGSDDPFIAYTFPTNSALRLRVFEQGLQGSSGDHFYRVTVGELPFVTGVYPLVVTSGEETPLQVFGYNLPGKGEVALAASEGAEVPLPEPFARFRMRRAWKIGLSPMHSMLETEPNDSVPQAETLSVPGAVSGQLTGGTNVGDVDCFVFEAKRGTRWVIETVASMRGSPADTRLEVLWPDGKPVERVRLRSVRNSAITFRNETSEDPGIRFENWEEMELNDLIYANGEVMKLFRAPQGPDSDSMLYSVGGKRRGYFDTTPLAHPLEQPVYVVVPMGLDEPAPANGLPVFRLNFENDDDAERRLGSDARLYFTAPADGRFVVRVSESRGMSGEDFSYRLVVRPVHPDISVTLAGANPTVAPGSGQSFTVSVNRLDGFDGPVAVELQHLPPGWTATTPLLIEAGQDSAVGTLTAPASGTAPKDAEWDAVTVVAQATIEGRPMAMAVNNLGRPKFASEKARLTLHLEPPAVAGSRTNAGPPEVLLTPGTTVTLKLVAMRNGFDGAVRFEPQNLPHGVIVDNLGLNGITLLAGETEREIFLTAARWVGELDRPFHLEETAVGRQASPPVWLRIRRTPGAASAK